MTATRIEIATDDGVAPAFVFDAPAAPAPSVLMLMDGIGMRPAMHALAERLAREGYRVLLPDAFYRAGAYTAPEPKALFGDPAVLAAWSARNAATTSAAQLKDIRAYLAWLGTEPVGVVGYCMGGRLALLAAATYPDRIAAAAAYHPGGLVTDAADSPHRMFDRIRASVYIGGAMDDRNLTDAQRQLVDDTLTAAGVDHVVELYQARHGWVPSDTPVHDEAATARHWKTMLALFQRTLRQAGL